MLLSPDLFVTRSLIANRSNFSSVTLANDYAFIIICSLPALNGFIARYLAFRDPPPIWDTLSFAPIAMEEVESLAAGNLLRGFISCYTKFDI